MPCHATHHFCRLPRKLHDSCTMRKELVKEPTVHLTGSKLVAGAQTSQAFGHEHAPASACQYVQAGVVWYPWPKQRHPPTVNIMDLNLQEHVDEWQSQAHQANNLQSSKTARLAWHNTNTSHRLQGDTRARCCEFNYAMHTPQILVQSGRWHKGVMAQSDAAGIAQPR